MKKLMLICFGFALCTCGPDPIPDPVAVQLVAPKNLDRCTTADKLNDTESQVNFVSPIITLTSITTPAKPASEGKPAVPERKVARMAIRPQKAAATPPAG